MVFIVIGSACRQQRAPEPPRALTGVCPLDSAPPRGAVQDGAVGSISIRLTDAATGRFLNDATLSDAVLQDSVGHRVRIAGPLPFRFTGLRAGRYKARVTRLGYNARVDTIELTSAAGQILTLPRTIAATDACGSRS